MIRMLAVAVVALSMAGPAISAEKEHLQKAQELAKICATHLLKPTAIKENLKERGFRYEGVWGETHFYTLDGRRLLAGTSRTSDKVKSCLVSVSKMTLNEATSIAAPIAKALKAKEFKAKDYDKAYVSDPRGGFVYAVTVEKHVNFRIMRGAAITIIALPED